MNVCGDYTVNHIHYVLSESLGRCKSHVGSVLANTRLNDSHFCCNAVEQKGTDPTGQQRENTLWQEEAAGPAQRTDVSVRNTAQGSSAVSDNLSQF